MDKKIEIKEEDPFADNTASENEREFFHEVVTIKTGIADVLLDSDCDVTVKTEIKSEAPFIKQIKAETATWSNNWEIDGKNEVEHQTVFSDIGSQNEGEFLFEHPVMMDKKDDSDHEMYNKIEIKEEAWWLQTESSSVCNNIKDGDLPPVKSSRLYPEMFPGGVNNKSPLLLAEVSATDTSFCNLIDHLEYKYKKCDVLTAKEDVQSDQYGTHSDEVDADAEPSYLKLRNFSHLSKTPQQCSICERSFRQLSQLRAHILNHEGKKSHMCKTCSKTFTQFSHLKRHNLIHDGKKPHQCKVCYKRFIDLSTLKRHKLLHDGKKPHQCKVCYKSFADFSNLKRHHLLHDGKKPHQCKVCNRSFNHLSNLKRHNLVHEGKKAHQCKVCNRSFAQYSNLKTHNLVHEGKKPYQCQICNTSFTHLSNLKIHNLVHEGKKPHQCKVCNRSFTQLSHLKRHNLVHEGKKPHQCKFCDKSFTQSSHLKRHILIHDAKNQHH